MTLSVLAILFLAVIVAVAIAGMRLLSGGPRQASPPPETERCALCRNAFATSDLVLRQVGDYKLLYFCRECVLKLYADLGLKN